MATSYSKNIHLFKFVCMHWTFTFHFPPAWTLKQLFYLTFCFLIATIFGIIDNYYTMENLKKMEENKIKLRTIYPKNNENFKNSKPRVQFIGSCKKMIVMK